MRESSFLSRALEDIDRHDEVDDDSDHVDVVFIPAGDDRNSDVSDDENLENDNDDEVDTVGGAYEYDLHKYDNNEGVRSPSVVTFTWCTLSSLFD